MKCIKWVLAVAILGLCFDVSSGSAQQANTKTTATDAQDTNIRAYIELLRSDVREKKTLILTQLMNLNDDQAEKFWPIYRDYDYELQALNDRKLAGIQEYAKTYDSMTDEKADELAKLALALENQRNDLKKRYYEKFREQLGGIIAARFLQVENQMLMVIDLQIASSLPIVAK
jgi:DNA anti-recombination protein RmuC